MKTPSIDELMESINDPRTKSSMDEVLSCFYSGNLRSAVVMLYTAVVSDLYYKICDLSDLYNDSGANLIKRYVNNEWKTRPTIPEWESQLPEKCRERNKILNNESYAHIKNLHDERNLCAHPVIIGYDIYRPNRVTVQSLIINMLQGILCRPSFLSKDFFNLFVDEIERISIGVNSRDKLKTSIKTKYLDKINNEKEEYVLFQKLWRFVFESTEERIKQNRNANYEILSLIYDRNKAYVENEFSKNVDYYAKHTNIEDMECACLFADFTNYRKNIYKLMPEDFKSLFEQKANGYNNLNAIAFCIVSDPLQHIKSIDATRACSVGTKIFKFIVDKYSLNSALDFAIDVYGKSCHFWHSDYLFPTLIEPYLDQMSEAQLTNIIENFDNNDQIYGGWRPKSAHDRSAIKKAILSKNPNFDFSPYQHLS